MVLSGIIGAQCAEVVLEGGPAIEALIICLEGRNDDRARNVVMNPKKHGLECPQCGIPWKGDWKMCPTCGFSFAEQIVKEEGGKLPPLPPRDRASEQLAVEEVRSKARAEGRAALRNVNLALGGTLISFLVISPVLYFLTPPLVWIGLCLFGGFLAAFVGLCVHYNNKGLIRIKYR